MALVFVNTRSQAETIFQQLWMVNEAGLPIALHHGSLDATQRRKVEAAMARQERCAPWCRPRRSISASTGAKSVIINVGAPKGSSRILQRIGRANHRPGRPRDLAGTGEPLRGAGMRGGARCGDRGRRIPRDRPSSSSMCCASIFSASPVPGRFIPTRSMPRSKRSFAYRRLERALFDKAVAFVSTWRLCAQGL